MPRVGVEVDQWERLETYRQRYPIDDRLGQVLSLEKSINRRKARAAALIRRNADLQKELATVQRELRAVDAEIVGSRDAGALLIEEIVDAVRIEMGEAWSPTPVKGFRVWSIKDNTIMGNQVDWPTPTLESRCLREIPGEDLPHSVARCGPPACGIYAVKDLDKFAPGVAGGVIHHSVVGIVAMHGKVVEHEEGYRSQKATAIAVSANDGEHRLITTDPATIEELFSDPAGALAGSDALGPTEQNPTRDFLVSAYQKEDKWT